MSVTPVTAGWQICGGTTSVQLREREFRTADLLRDAFISFAGQLASLTMLAALLLAIGALGPTDRSTDLQLFATSLCGCLAIAIAMQIVSATKPGGDWRETVDALTRFRPARAQARTRRCIGDEPFVLLVLLDTTTVEPMKVEQLIEVIGSERAVDRALLALVARGLVERVGPQADAPVELTSSGKREAKAARVAAAMKRSQHPWPVRRQ